MFAAIKTSTYSAEIIFVSILGLLNKKNQESLIKRSQDISTAASIKPFEIIGRMTSSDCIIVKIFYRKFSKSEISSSDSVMFKKLRHLFNEQLWTTSMRIKQAEWKMPLRTCYTDQEAWQNRSTLTTEQKVQ